MKPFDLEAALRGEPVVTRDGRPVTKLHLFNDVHTVCCLYGVIDGYVMDWLPNGSHVNAYKSNEYDLFMAEKPKVKRERWVNLYKYSSGAYCCGDVYKSKDEAANSTTSRALVATIRIEWEEEG